MPGVEGDIRNFSFLPPVLVCLSVERRGELFFGKPLSFSKSVIFRFYFRLFFFFTNGHRSAFTVFFCEMKIHSYCRWLICNINIISEHRTSYVKTPYFARLL